MSRLIDLALALARSGYAVLPVRGNKAPACPHGFKDATRDPQAVARLFTEHRAELVGVATGAPSGVAVLDIDPPGLVWLDANAAQLPATVRVRTRRAGFHFWFALAGAPPPSRAGTIAPGVDTRGRDAYCIAWEPEALIAGRARLAPWPEWLDDALRPKPIPFRPPPAGAAGPAHDGAYALAALRNELRRLESTAEGARNDALNIAAFALGRFVHSGALDQYCTATALLQTALAIGLPESSSLRTIRSGFEAAARKGAA